MCKDVPSEVLQQFQGTLSTSTSCKSKAKCDKKPPIIPSQYLGTCNYYLWRHSNFLQRHCGCGHTPPDYYLCYGYKYCERFSKHLAPSLGAAGKDWLRRARSLLQYQMENGLSTHSSIELDNLGFRSFAFGTHTGAYLGADMSHLSIEELAKIATEPDITEWIPGLSDTAGDTWKQALQVGAVVLEDIGTQVSNGVKQFLQAPWKELWIKEAW